jgi:hypothetical protein
MTLVMLALTLTAGAGAVSAGAQTPPAPRSAQSLDARAEHQRIVDFWTPERRAAAIPLEITRPTPARGKPGGGGGGGGGGTPETVLGATWSGGGAVAKTTGRVFFQSGQWLYSCSGSAVQSQFGSLVVTAGHCVHEGNGGSFYTTNWIFYPGYSNGADPTLGAWTATDLFTTTTWATAPNGFADDLGLATVIGPSSGPSANKTLTQALAAVSATVPTIAFTPAPTNGTYYTAFGYPAGQKYKGGTLVYCQGPVTVGLDLESSLAVGCDMTGGSSGGPWFREFTNGSSMVINSLNSYGYSSLKGYMFGPMFDGGEQAAYTAANTATGVCPGSSGTFRCAHLSAGGP